MCRSRHILVVLNPAYSEATILDSKRGAGANDYEQLKTVLDRALAGFNYSGGHIVKKKVYRGTLTFRYVNLACQKYEDYDWTMDAYYIFHHMEEYFRDQEKLLLASQKNIVRGKDWANCDPKELREEFIASSGTLRQ